MDFNHIHLYVGDLDAACRYFAAAWGGVEPAREQPGTWRLVWLGAVPVMLSAPSKEGTAEATYLTTHPDGVGDVAFRVGRLDEVVERVLAMGGHLCQPVQRDRWGLRWCQVQGWGDLRHTLIETGGKETDGDPAASSGVWLPELGPVRPGPSPLVTPFQGIDHAVLNLPQGQLAAACQHYQRQLGFQPRQGFEIHTPHSGLRSQVMAHPSGSAQLPINEPTTTNSQIAEFLQWNRGAGIQHIALRTAHIVDTIAQLRQRGVAFLQVPATYYQALSQRLGGHLPPHGLAALAQQEILMDWEPNCPQASLLQTFSQPLFGIPTLFFEIIQRQPVAMETGQRLAIGFGEGNFQALFEAIEREQQRRGSLHAASGQSPTPDP